MIFKGWISAALLLVLALTWTGCRGGPGTGKTDYVCTDDEIRVTDTLILTFLEIGPTDVTDKAFVVRSDGKINLPLLGSVQASGKRFDEFEKEVQAAYIRSNFYNRITVVVKPGDRFYTVGGEVKNGGGRMIYMGQTTVLRAIASCGDFNEFAHRRKVEIIRANGSREIVDCIEARKNPKLDRPICPGDAVFVPRSL